METKLDIQILPQPNLMTCGPTCLHSIYRYYGSDIALPEVVKDVRMLQEGGTIAVLLALDALKRGFKARIYTYNLVVFDPSWFLKPGVDLSERLRAQVEIKKDNTKLVQATEGYLEFLRLGGEMKFQDLTPRLIRQTLEKGIPILTGLSSTYLYHEPRETEDCYYDDLHGVPGGHFVVLCGYDRQSKEILIADPLLPNPIGQVHYYTLPIERVIGAIFLGILTHDANLLVIEPKGDWKGSAHGNLLRGR